LRRRRECGSVIVFRDIDPYSFPYLSLPTGKIRKWATSRARFVGDSAISARGLVIQSGG
jgi:hypothetical protein